MSEETALHSEEEVDVLSLLATQSEDVEDDDGEVGTPETIEDALEVINTLKERVSKRNKSLKKAKQAQHRTQSEYETLAERLERLEQTPAQTDNRSEQSEQEAQAWRDRVEDDPTQAIGYVDNKLASFEDRMARFLDTKFSEFGNQMSEWQGQTNPERQQYAQQMETLRSNPQFADLDDDVLLKVAKGLATAKVKRPPSTIGGQRGGSTSDKAPEITADDLRKMGF